MVAINPKYRKYFEDERQWKHVGVATATTEGVFKEEERYWRSEWTSMGKEHLDDKRFGMIAKDGDTFIREHLPDRGGWSCRRGARDFRTKGHHRDPKADFVDQGAVKSWRKAISRDSAKFLDAPLVVADDRESQIRAALAALRRTEQALWEAGQNLHENRVVMLDLLHEDFTALKAAAQQLQRDRDALMEDVSSSPQHIDLSGLRSRARELETERKELLVELEDEIRLLDKKSTSTKQKRERAQKHIRNNRQILEGRVAEMIDDAKLKWIRTHWEGLESLNKSMWSDRESIVQQIMRYWPGLKFVAQHVKNDRKILIEAVHPHLVASLDSNSGIIDKQMLQTCDAMICAVMEDSTSMELMESKMRQSRVVVNQVIKDDWKNLEKAADLMRMDRALVTAIVDQTMADGKF